MRKGRELGARGAGIALVLGFLTGAVGSQVERQREVQPAAASRAWLAQARAAPGTLEAMNARELRSLPGLGVQRADDLVRERWRRSRTGSRLLLTEVPGIGPGTEDKLRTWLSEQAPAPRTGVPICLGP